MHVARDSYGPKYVVVVVGFLFQVAQQRAHKISKQITKSNEIDLTMDLLISHQNMDNDIFVEKKIFFFYEI